MEIKERIWNLFHNVNFWRAAVIYAVSLGIGLFGVFVIGGTLGWYMLTCFPGFGSGVAAALLGNGYKKPVTVRSSVTTFVMLLIFTAGSWIVGVPLLAMFVGLGLSFVGSFCGLQFCRWENKKNEASKTKTRTRTKANSADPV